MVRHQHVDQLRQQDHRVSIPLSRLFILLEIHQFRFTRRFPHSLRGNNPINLDAAVCSRNDRGRAWFRSRGECKRGRDRVGGSKVQETRVLLINRWPLAKLEILCPDTIVRLSLCLCLSVCGRAADPSRVIIEKSRMDQ